MNYTDKQFAEVLNQASVTISEDFNFITYEFDNYFFALDASFNIKNNEHSLCFYVQNEEQEVSEDNYSKFLKDVDTWIDYIEEKKKEIKEIIKYNEKGF